MSSLTKYLPAFLLGFMALAWQVLLLREFTAHFYGNELVIGILLGAWLLWSGTGSLLADRVRFSRQRFSFLYYFALLVFPVCLFILRFSRFPLQLLPGETTGLLPALIFSLVLCFFICLPLGTLFVFNTHIQEGRIARVYLLEALGSAFSGVLLYFVLIPRLSNWESTAVVGSLTALLVFLSLPRKRSYFLPLILITAALIGFGRLDFPTQQRFWDPYVLTASTDSRYGKLQMIRSQEQYSLYNNGVVVFTLPDQATAEEAVHFALLQQPEAEEILLIGGGAGGALAEILKYPDTRVDYVELDPEIIRFTESVLPEAERRALEDARVEIFLQDGRAFLASSQKQYDVIILNLPDPSTAQINRFYTEEFFLLARQKMAARGILSLRVSSAENYISEELQGYLASVYATLSAVFDDILVFPGGNNIFLASRHLPRLNTADLVERIRRYKLDNIYLSPQMLPARLSPLRTRSLMDAIQAHPGQINRDLQPISYYWHALIWATQFHELESRLIKFFAKLGSRWLLDLPLALFCIMLVAIGTKGGQPAYFQTALVLSGLTTIMAEIMTILAFQAAKGYLYHSLALLFAVFMLGLVLGAKAGGKIGAIGITRLIAAQAFIVGLLILLWPLLSMSLPAASFYLFLFLLGLLGGYLFVVTNTLYLHHRKDYGRGYGLDLLGGFFGALGTSSILIPLLGIPAVLGHLILANSACLGFLLWGKLRHQA